MIESARSTVYYDGSCSLCTVAAGSLDEQYEKKDITRSALPPHISKSDAMRDVHIVDADGTTYAGVDAILHIFDSRPGYRMFAQIARLPGFHMLARILYRIIASERHWLFGKRLP